MSVVEIIKRPNARPVEEDWQSRRAKLSFAARVNDKDDGPVQALQEASNWPDTDFRVPAVGQAHPDDGLLVCVRRSVQATGGEEGQAYWYDIDCEYSTGTELPGGLAGTTTLPTYDISPENRSPQYSFANVYYSEPVKLPTDPNGLPTNAVGDPFDPLPTVTRSAQVVDIIRYEARSFNQIFKTLTDYNDTLNSTDFGPPGSAEVWAPKTVKLAISTTSEYIGGAYFWRVHYHLETKQGFSLPAGQGGGFTGHQPAAPEMGYHYFFELPGGLVGPRLRFTDFTQDEQEVPRPVLGFLTAQGFALNGNNNGTTNGSQVPHIRSWDFYEVKDWEPLNLWGNAPTGS